MAQRNENKEEERLNNENKEKERLKREKFRS